MKLAKKYEEYYPKWDEVIGREIKSQFIEDGDEESTEEEFDKRFKDVHEVLSRLVVLFAKESKVRDKFDLPIHAIVSRYQAAEIKSAKLDTTFTFGIYKNIFYLDARFRYPHYLKSMDDEFWKCMTELADFGDFAFQENVLPSTATAESVNKIMGKSKSSIFKLIKNYILLEESGMPGDIRDLGSLEVSWPITVSWPELIEYATKSFRILHKINYLLYRRYYLSNR